MSEGPDLAILVLVCLQILSLILLLTLYKRYKSLLKSSKILTDALRIEADALKEKHKLRPQSMELSEFLSDTRSLGFSFVRVEPDSVFIRAPRDHKP